MRTALPALIAGVVALVIGAGGMWFFVSANEPTPRTGNSDHVADKPLDTTAPLTNEAAVKTTESRSDSDKKAAQETIDALRAWAQEAEKEARETQQQLEKDKADLQAEIVRLEGRVAELEKLAAGPNNLLVGFGKWAEIKELRETEWKQVGDAVKNMNPHLADLTKAILDGQDPPPEVMQKIQEQNRRILSEYGKIIGKLPTNSGYNGEFTHPIYFMNMLAAQLEAAGDPLTEQQIEEIVSFGEEFDSRWAKLQEGYTDTTWMLTKILDEAELKDWFVTRMFEVTTPDQEAVARPPEVKGYLGLDLYSVGLMLSGHVRPIARADQLQVREQLKEDLVDLVGLTQEQLGTVDYLFDDWLNSLATQLQPRPKPQTDIHQTSEVLASGRAQITAMKALETNFAFTHEERAKYRVVQRIALPLVYQQE